MFKVLKIIIFFIILIELVIGMIRQEGRNHTNSLNCDITDNQFIMSNNEYFNRNINLEEMDYCADIGHLEKNRRIPKISNFKQYNKMNLIQLQIVARHGARTPIHSNKCWEGYDQKWDCDHLKTFFQISAINKKNNTQTIEFSKHYSIKELENNLNGTCKVGQLILQGYEQHRINGKLIAEAYFKKGDHLVTKDGLEINFDFREEIYIRSSDMQRTTVSAAALITTLLEEIFGKEETFENFRNLPIHTMDILSDYLFSNKNILDNSQQLKYLYSSKEFQELIENHKNLFLELDRNAKVYNITSSWPIHLIDCLFTLICTKNYHKLPKAFFINNLLNRTISAVEKEVSAIYTWDSSIISKRDISRLMFDIRDYIIDVILYNENKNDKMFKIKALCSKFKENDNNIQDVSIDLQYLINPLCTKYRHFYSLNNQEIQVKVPKFILFSGHDTTLIPLLSSMQIWDKRLPPYASTFNLEIYYDTNNNNNEEENYNNFNNFSNSKLNQNFLPYYIRLIYNGLVITNQLKGCIGIEICHVSFFFFYL